MKHAARKIAAWSVLASAGPLLVDVATEPYADRGLVRSWLHGTAKLVVIVGGDMVLSWACREVAGDADQA